MLLKRKLCQEKFTITQSNKGSVDIVIICFFILGVIVIPMFVIISESLALKVAIKQTKENLELSTIHAYAAINTNELGIGVLEFDETKIINSIKDEFNKLSLNLKDYIELDSLKTKIECTDNKYIITNEVLVNSKKYNKRLPILSKMSYSKDPVMGD